MTTLAFPKELYRGTAVDEAAKVFGPFATLALREEPAAWVVEVSAPDAARERQVAGELGNYALGVTVKGGAR